ncbi:MAG TPA: HAD-IIA family hydrolase [Anaerolineaceae bacterium]
MNDFSALKSVRCFVLDMDGTFFLGSKLLPGAKDFLAWLERHGKEYMFLSNNSSRSREQYVEKLKSFGVDVTLEHIFTSGEATGLALSQEYPGARIYAVGTPALEQELTAHGLRLVQEDAQVAVLGFDTSLTYAKLWKLCDLVRAGLPYIATHADINCPIEGGWMPDIGSMISLVATSTGRYPDLVVGKPNRTIVEMLVQRTGIPTTRMAMIGDRLYTDIAMGAAGLKTILVMSGETRLEDLPASAFQPDFIVENLADLLEKVG